MIPAFCQHAYNWTSFWRRVFIAYLWNWQNVFVYEKINLWNDVLVIIYIPLFIYLLHIHVFLSHSL